MGLSRPLRAADAVGTRKSQRMGLLTNNLDLLPVEEVEVDSLPAELRWWVKSVYAGCEPYFVLPEKISFRQVRAVQSWKTLDRDRQRYEAKYGTRLSARMKQWGRTISDTYERTERVSDALETADRIFDEGPFRKELADIWNEVGVHFYRKAEAEINGKADADEWEELDSLQDPDFSSYVNRAVAQKVTKVSASTRSYIAGVINAGLREGKSIRDIVDELQASIAFSRYRSFLIARTETIGASNAATHYAYGKHLDRSLTEKEWLATGDARTRKTHSAANGQRVGFNDLFSVGAAQLAFPADTESGAGHPEEVIQCRCTLLYHPVKTPTAPGARTPRRRRPGAPGAPLEELTAASVRQQVIDELEDLAREVEGLDELIEGQRQLSRDLIRKRGHLASNRLFTREVEAEWREEYHATREELYRLEARKIKKRTTARRERFLKAWNPTGKKSSVFTLEVDPFQPKHVNKRKLKAAKGFLERLGGVEGHEEFRINVRRLPEGKRAYQESFSLFDAGTGKWDHRSEIYLAPEDGIEVAVHEAGHSMDTMAREHADKVEAFYKRRTAGEPLEKLRDVTGGNYKETEVTRRDKFIHPYQGKEYKFRNDSGSFASEVTSMGVQMLYEDPLKVAQQDPELFEFLWDLFAKPAPAP